MLMADSPARLYGGSAVPRRDGKALFEGDRGLGESCVHGEKRSGTGGERDTVSDGVRGLGI